MTCARCGSPSPTFHCAPCEDQHRRALLHPDALPTVPLFPWYDPTPKPAPRAAAPLDLFTDGGSRT